ncbi:MAG: hypothetical protein GY906_26535, partial [bacterium]|nr:hypothetical protein [bacterium]
RPRLANPTEAAASLAAELGENLPQVIDEVTTLEKVNAAGEFLTMELRFPHHTLVEMAPSAAAIREDVGRAVCDSELKRMIAIGVAINYVYYSADSQVVTQFTQSLH